MKTFRPADVDLASPAKPDSDFGDGGAGGGPGAPVTRSVARLEASDGGLRSGVWDSSAGQKDFVFATDEWAYILEGEAEVTAAGKTHVLRAGDVFYTPAGERMSWVVPSYVRKVWVHRRPPFIGRVRRKLRRILARR